MVVLHDNSQLKTHYSRLRIPKRDVERHLEVRKGALVTRGCAGMREQDTRRSANGIERSHNPKENADAANLQHVRIEHGCAWFVRPPGSILQNDRVEGHRAVAEVIEP